MKTMQRAPSSSLCWSGWRWWKPGFPLATRELSFPAFWPRWASTNKWHGMTYLERETCRGYIIKRLEDRKLPECYIYFVGVFVAVRKDTKTPAKTENFVLWSLVLWTLSYAASVVHVPSSGTESELSSFGTLPIFNGVNVPRISKLPKLCFEIVLRQLFSFHDLGWRTTSCRNP